MRWHSYDLNRLVLFLYTNLYTWMNDWINMHYRWLVFIHSFIYIQIYRYTDMLQPHIPWWLNAFDVFVSLSLQIQPKWAGCKFYLRYASFKWLNKLWFCEKMQLLHMYLCTYAAVCDDSDTCELNRKCQKPSGKNFDIILFWSLGFLRVQFTCCIFFLLFFRYFCYLCYFRFAVLALLLLLLLLFFDWAPIVIPCKQSRNVSYKVCA